jgi:hypothetical protein
LSCSCLFKALSGLGRASFVIAEAIELVLMQLQLLIIVLEDIIVHYYLICFDAYSL